MDKEMKQFQADLLQSVREMKAAQAARVTRIGSVRSRSNARKRALPAAHARHKTGGDV